MVRDRTGDIRPVFIFVTTAIKLLPLEQLLKFYNLRCKVQEYQNNTTLDNFSPKSIKKLTLIHHGYIHSHTPPLFTLTFCLYNVHLF